MQTQLFNSTFLATSLIASATIIATARADEPAASPRSAQVRSAQRIVADLQPQLRLASSRLLAESLDRSREIGEHAHWLSVTEFELQQVESHLSEQEHQSGTDAFENAVNLKRTATELRQQRDQLQTQHRALSQQHHTRLAERQRPATSNRSEPQREALLSILKSRLSSTPLFDQPIRVETAKPVLPADSTESVAPLRESAPATTTPTTLLPCPPCPKRR